MYHSFPRKLLCLYSADCSQSTYFFTRELCILFSFFPILCWYFGEQHWVCIFFIFYTYRCATIYESEQFQYESLKIIQFYIASSELNSEWWLLETLSENNYRVLSESKFINKEIKGPSSTYISWLSRIKDMPIIEREEWQCRNSAFLFFSQHRKQAHVSMWIVFRTPKKPLFEPLLW